MTDRRLLIALILLVLVILLAVVGGFNCSLHAAEVTNTIEVSPATQPITTAPDGSVVVAPPVVRVSAQEDPWGIVKWIAGVGAIIVAIRILVLPPLGAFLKDVLQMKGDLGKVIGQTEAQESRLDRQGEEIKQIRGTGDGTLPPGVQ